MSGPVVFICYSHSETGKAPKKIQNNAMMVRSFLFVFSFLAWYN